MTFSDVRNILVIKLRHIGDVLLTVPVFRALKESFPRARLTALVNAGTEDILRGNALIDRVIALDRSVKDLSLPVRLVRETAFIAGIRKARFDMTVDLTGGDRAALLSLLSGAAYRIGWMPKKGFPGKRRCYTHLCKPDSTRHMVLQNLDVVARWGIDTDDLSVGIPVTPEDRAAVDALLERHGFSKNGKAVHIHPTSRWLFKCWNDRFMAGIIRRLLKEGATVIVTSSPDRREIRKAKAILSAAGPDDHLIDLCGRTTLKQLAAVSGRSRLFFGVDSAPMHVAAATGIPVVALFGPSGAFNWGPWYNGGSRRELEAAGGTPYPRRNGIQTFGTHTVIQEDFECVPCGSDGCQGSKISRCLEELGVDVVTAILLEKLHAGVRQ
ncbi:MAG TPA: putative lipopolysaccharide heptosyltransferase III [Dissulfurispiraceae bacterium]|nr:putative lipopolysaccharide heptosyltransferase III [Dissulfurispiraceae bacterium]